MGTYYAFEGSLTFGSKKEAADALTQLRAQSFFWSPNPKAAKDLVVAGATLTFASKGFGGDYEEFIDARILLRELATKACAGHVQVQAGDGGAGTEIDRFGFKPAAGSSGAGKKRAKSAASGPAAKKTTATRTKTSAGTKKRTKR